MKKIVKLKRDNNDKMLSRLDGILILLLLLKENDSPLKMPILFHQLKSVGFTNEEIANISGKTSDQVAKIAYEFKRLKTKK